MYKVEHENIRKKGPNSELIAYLIVFTIELKMRLLRKNDQQFFKLISLQIVESISYILIGDINKNFDGLELRNVSEQRFYVKTFDKKIFIRTNIT